MIVFKRITFQNFLSVGNTPVSVNLNDSKTTLIHGANGCGKSLILDALTYALYNRGFRSIRLPQLINSANKKGLLVEIEFAIGNNTYIVQRGQKPKVFALSINGKTFDKLAADKDTQTHLEQNILKLNYKSFCQVCILGSANYIPFMQLNPASRRECIEDFLDIKVFSIMSVIAKERLRGLKEEIRTLEGDISNWNYKQDIQNERIQEIKEKEAESTQEYKDELKLISEKIHDLRVVLDRLQEHRSRVSEMCERLDETRPNDKVSQVQKMIAKLETKTDRLHADNDFYNKNDNCPTCRQGITTETKLKNIKDNDKKIDTNIVSIMEGQKVLDKLSIKVRMIERRYKYISNLNNTITKYQTEMINLEGNGKRVANKLRAVEEDTGALDRETLKLEMLCEQIELLEKRKGNLVESISEHDIVHNLLKDNGIKTQIVKKYLPVMNKLIRQYLQELDLPIHFKLDEQFDETISSPMHKDFSYASFSEGQKARIDLSLMFTWREVGKLKNSVSTNLLILDEVFSSSLDETGKELLLGLLRYKLPDDNNIVVVDHTLSGEFKSKFDKSIEVTRVKGFSKYQS